MIGGIKDKSQQSGFTPTPEQGLASLKRTSKKSSPCLVSGFTYVELLVAIAIFAIVAAGLVGIFDNVFKEQTRNLEKIELLNAASYMTEYMARALRMAKKDINGDCLATAKTNYEAVGSSIYFLSYDNLCSRFFLDADGLIKVDKSPLTDPPTLPAKVKLQGPIALMPGANLQADILTFYAQGDGQLVSDESLYFQPNVTIVLKLKTKSANPEQMHFQTSVTQREHDIQN